MLTEWTGQKPEETWGLQPKAGGAGSPKSGCGVYWTTGDMMHETKLAVFITQKTGTAVYGTVRTVVWEDGGGDPAS